MKRSLEVFLSLVVLGLASVMTVNYFVFGSVESVDLSNDPELVLVKGGTFLMGQDDGESDEKPVHKVTLSDFYIGKYEVTVAEYQKFCEETKRPMPKEPEWGWKDKHPIFNVSWNDAAAYINWLNKKTGNKYRLPTEAEFEYVVRNGGKPGKYPWGDGKPTENIGDESRKGMKLPRTIWKGYNDGFANTAPVGSFPANELGVHDIAGNVWEWCSDWHTEYIDTAKVNPKGPETGKNKIGRGAGYLTDPWHARSASRNFVGRDFKGPGFRLAKDAKN